MYTLLTEPLILASGSPRRSEMLTGCGIAYEKKVSECDEAIIPGESAKDMVERLARLKAETVAALYTDRWVLGADTTVVVDGEILGKPEDINDAYRMLSHIQGRTHDVWGGFCLTRSGQSIVESHLSKVTIMPLNAESIRAYVETKEPMDKAGSYAIQGIGASLVSEVTGSYTNVVGLNLAAVINAMLNLSIIKRG